MSLAVHPLVPGPVCGSQTGLRLVISVFGHSQQILKKSEAGTGYRQSLGHGNLSGETMGEGAVEVRGPAQGSHRAMLL